MTSPGTKPLGVLVHIVVGYLQLQLAGQDAAEEVARMRALGATVVRVEEGVGDCGPIKPMLRAICEFIGPGDELITPNLRHLGASVGAVLEVIRRLQARGARLRLLEPETCTDEAAGRALIRALEQLGPADPGAPARGARKIGRRVDPREIQALRANGLGPTEIAQRLGVSRMTVWRALSKPADARGPDPVEGRPAELALSVEP